MAWSSNSKFSIEEKLNETNHQILLFKRKMVLIKEELWEVLKEERPNDNTERQASCNKNNNKGMAVISLCIQDSQLTHIQKLEMARSMWNEQKDLYVKAV